MNARAVLLVVLMATAAASTAQAAPWQRVTTPDGSSTDQVGLARTADGVLHVVWHHPTGPNTEDLLHTTIWPSGQVGVRTPIQTGWVGFTNPALVVERDGLRVFWGGFRTTDPNDPQNETNTAFSSNEGVSWALQPGAVVPPGAQSYASNTAATVRADGSTLQAFAGSLGTWVHSGLTPSTPNHDFQAALGPYGFDPSLATSAADVTVLGWYSNARRHLGVQVQSVSSDGSPVGGTTTMPDTEDMEVGMSGRTPLVARQGGGFYVAYPTGYPRSDRVRLWRVGATAAPVIGRVDGSSRPAVAIAGARDGRLWVIWTEGFGDPDVLARRSNETATRFGATVNAGHPRDALQAYNIDASASAKALDVLGNFNIEDSAVAVTSYRHLLPGLTLQAEPVAVRKGEATEVRFTVLDAGEAVGGARVRAADASGTSDARGKVTLRIKSGRTVTASATRSGYTRATKRLDLRN
jgi:hypothetical protein